MKPLRFVLLLFLTSCVAPGTQVPVQPPPLVWSVCFTPPFGCADFIIGELIKVRETIPVQAYQFTSKLIADALIAAHQRGVKVSVLLDTGNGGRTKVYKLPGRKIGDVHKFINFLRQKKEKAVNIEAGIYPSFADFRKPI
jgi:phosphatidylserine/phosphatidylglycerophosphate/cardiolipin synthase-like enzyme